MQALERGLALLQLLAQEHRATLTELGSRIGLPPSTAFRLLATLKEHGFADFDAATQSWTIGVEAFRVGSAYLNCINLLDVARDIMHELVDITGETANLGIADRGDVVFISQVETQNPVRAFFPPGTRSHMHASGVGKALLAYTPQSQIDSLLQSKGLPKFTARTLIQPNQLSADLALTRERGWAYDEEEHYVGMSCIAAPVFNAHGEAVAGLSVSGPAARFGGKRAVVFGATVCSAAARLSARLGSDQGRHLQPAEM